MAGHLMLNDFLLIRAKFLARAASHYGSNPLLELRTRPSTCDFRTSRSLGWRTPARKSSLDKANVRYTRAISHSNYRMITTQERTPTVYSMPTDSHQKSPITFKLTMGKITRNRGIIGVTLLHRHMTLLHRGDMHVIDLSKLSPFAKLFKSGLQGGPYFSTEGRETRLTFKTLEDVTLDNCLAFARAYPDPPFDYFNPRPIDSTFTVLEKCRTCGKLENEESKLFRCSKCSTERRSRSALYCSKDCQRADWKARHKEEHAGVREWDLGATIDVT